MTRLFSHLLFSLLFLAVTAEGAKALTKDEIASRLKLYQNIASLKANFEQEKLVKDLDVRIESSGKFSFVSPEKVSWEVTKPSLMRMTLDGEKVSIRSGEGSNAKEETYRLGSQMGEGAAKSLTRMTAWLKMDVNAISSSYDVYQEKSGEYRCVPKKGEEALFESLTIKLHPSGHMERLILGERSGDLITIQFSKPEITRRK
jgi:outer membrane lipoprotein-sorting protein